jgi:hypothetical protein
MHITGGVAWNMPKSSENRLADGYAQCVQQSRKQFHGRTMYQAFQTYAFLNI